jgi:SAM-dependent methyltransferase
VPSKLVGPTGRVVGVDVTAGQLAVANQYADFRTKRFGLAAPNVEFRRGLIGDLRAAASADLIASNWVVNLSPDTPAVFPEAFRALKSGGEMYFADVFEARHISDELRTDSVLDGECLGGVMYWNDFLTAVRDARASPTRADIVTLFGACPLAIAHSLSVAPNTTPYQPPSAAFCFSRRGPISRLKRSSISSAHMLSCRRVCTYSRPRIPFVCASTGYVTTSRIRRRSAHRPFFSA